jgi:hypothetical protein
MNDSSTSTGVPHALCVIETSGLDVCGACSKGDWAVGVGGEKSWPPDCLMVEVSMVSQASASLSQAGHGVAQKISC